MLCVCVCVCTENLRQVLLYLCAQFSTHFNSLSQYKHSKIIYQIFIFTILDNRVQHIIVVSSQKFIQVLLVYRHMYQNQLLVIFSVELISKIETSLYKYAQNCSSSYTLTNSMVENKYTYPTSDTYCVTCSWFLKQ